MRGVAASRVRAIAPHRSLPNCALSCLAATFAGLGLAMGLQQSVAAPEFAGRACALGGLSAAAVSKIEQQGAAMAGKGQSP